MGSTKWMLAACLTLPMLGCAGLNDFHYEQTQHHRARAAWHDHGSYCGPRTYRKDYECGWKDGFYDIATGNKGCPPVVAPCRYWQPSQILKDCDHARLAYYNGFQDGVACALHYPQTHYLKLWTSCECPGPSCGNQCCPTGGYPCGGCPSGTCGNDTGLISADNFPAASEMEISEEGAPIPLQEDVPNQPTKPAAKPPAVQAPSAAPVPSAAPAVNPNKLPIRKPVDLNTPAPLPDSKLEIDTSPTKPESIPGPAQDASVGPKTGWMGVEAAAPYDLELNGDLTVRPIGYRMFGAADEMIEDRPMSSPLFQTDQSHSSDNRADKSL